MKFIDWVGFLCLVIALMILWQFRQILLLTFTAVVLATALNRLVLSVQRRLAVSRIIGVVIALLIVLLGATLFFGLVVPPFVNQFQQLIELVPEGFRRLSVWINHAIDEPPYWFPIQDLKELAWLDSINFNFPDLLRQSSSIAQRVFGNFVTFFSNSLAVLLQLLLLAVLTFMFVGSPTAYRDIFIRLFPSFYRRRVDEILTKCETSLVSWMAGVSVNSLFVAAFSAIGLLILQVDFVFAHALLAGVFNFIPNIGPTLSAIFPVAVALLDSPGKALAVIILYLVIQNVESYWFSPMMMQKQVSLLPAATLLAQIFFTMFLGPLGLILALPLAVVTKTWIEELLIKDVFDPWQYNPFRSQRDLDTTVEVVFAGAAHAPDPMSTELEGSEPSVPDAASAIAPDEVPPMPPSEP
ncbi:MAG: AI-2E family transporter [Synechococcales cyanobacterium T60_A2020_003]|nr:AI-2E family transporter [Synechococcales cyanobacterium T60_A2020_003]